MATNANLIRKGIIAALLLLFLVSAEASVKAFVSSDGIVPLSLARIFGAPLVSLVLLHVEFFLGAISGFIRVALEKMSSGLEDGDAWAEAIVALAKASFRMVHLLFKVVEWAFAHIFK
jgi:hypothetical protein